MPERRGLGRGLEVLLGGAGTSELAELPVDLIHASPRQPRRRFDSEAGAGLAESVRAQGVVQPVVVRPRVAGGYELIAGERRWRAAREAKLATVPAVVREADDRDSLLLGLVENIAREDLSPVEEARAFAVVLDEFGLSLGDLAEQVGKSKPTVSNRVRLLELPEDVLKMLERGHEVSVLDEDPEAIAQLEKGLSDSWVDSGGLFTVGTALEMDALEEAGIERADAFVASTDGDNTNLVIAQIAQKRFNIRTVVVRVLDPARAQWYGQQGLHTICPTQVAIEMFDDAVTGTNGGGG